MADLSGRDRGQIVLIAAFILAVTFIILAIVVNTAIFTENLATRGGVSGSAEALQYQHELNDTVGTVIVSANADNNASASTTSLEANVSDSVTNISDQSGRQQASMGRVVNASYESETFGFRIAQDNGTDRAFTSAAGDSTWQPATDVDRTRNFEMNVTAIDGNFVLDLNGTSDRSWNMTLSGSGLNTAANDIDLEVERPGVGSQECTRTIEDQDFTVDVTGGTFDGEPCHALRLTNDGDRMWLASGISGGYDITFDGDTGTVEGTYAFVIDGGGNPQDATGNVSDRTGTTGTPPNEPYYKDAIYEVEVTGAYVTSEVGYETGIRVAPGEVPP